MKTSNERGLFDEEIRLEKLSVKGDPLEKLNECIPWRMFEPILQDVFAHEAKGPGGRPPYEYVMMFKVLILQRYYGLSDGQTEYQITDRLSFMRFLGLGLADRIPDEKTVWLFREALTKAKAIEKLFELFGSYLENQGLIAHEGQIIDASFVEVPRQRNRREENKEIKAGNVPAAWKEKPAMLRQKDTDARWAKKNKERHYGYKNHVKICKRSKLIETYGTTDASVHDSQAVSLLVEQSNEHQELYADSAYSGEPLQRVLEKHGMVSRIHEKGYRGKPLTEEQKLCNTEKSRIRARVEHVFGFIENSMHGLWIRCIGKQRAHGIVGLINLTYNLFRFLHLRPA